MTSPADMRARADLLEVLGDANSATMLRDAAGIMDEMNNSLGILRAMFAEFVRARFAAYDAAHNSKPTVN